MIGHHNIDIYEASRTTRHSARVPGVPAVLRGHDFSDAALERVRSEWPPGEGVVHGVAQSAKDMYSKERS